MTQIKRSILLGGSPFKKPKGFHLMVGIQLLLTLDTSINKIYTDAKGIGKSPKSIFRK
jgi:hypothetical protein